MRTLFITLSVIASLTSCTNKQPVVYENDTEPHDWVGTTTIKERPNAHSGKSVSIIDSTNAYSLGFQKKIQDISPEKVKSLTVSYWILIKDFNAKGKTVFGIDLNGKNINWQGPIFQDRVKELNTWIPISETFTLPENVDPQAVLTTYVLNESKSEIFVDDLQIKVN